MSQSYTWIFIQENEYANLENYKYPKVHSSIIHNSQDMEAN